jgi:hypothetical protein
VSVSTCGGLIHGGLIFGGAYSRRFTVFENTVQTCKSNITSNNFQWKVYTEIFFQYVGYNGEKSDKFLSPP